MNKKKILIMAAFILIIAVCIFIVLNIQTYYYINQINKSLNAGEFKLLTKVEDVRDTLEQQFVEHPGFGGRFYTNEGDGTVVVFSGFPDVTTYPYSLTRIEVKNIEYSLYDIHVGDNVDKATDVLKKKGFRRQESENKYHLTYAKSKIYIGLQLNEKDEITEINIQLQSTNRHNVVF